MSDIVSLVTVDRSLCESGWRKEVVGVPWCLKSITIHVELDAHESDKNCSVDRHSSLVVVFDKRIHFRHKQECHAGQHCDRRNNVSFATILLSWGSHEVFGDKHFTVLILVKSKYWNVVQDGIYNSRCANNVGYPSDYQPKELINQIVTDSCYNNNKAS